MQHLLDSSKSGFELHNDSGSLFFLGNGLGIRYDCVLMFREGRSLLGDTQPSKGNVNDLIGKFLASSTFMHQEKSKQ